MELLYMYCKGEKHPWGNYGNGKIEQSVCEYMNVYMIDFFLKKNLWALLNSKTMTQWEALLWPCVDFRDHFRKCFT